MRYFLILLLLISNNSFSTEIFKCIVDGRTVFTDSPCSGQKVDFNKINSISTTISSDKNYSSTQWYAEFQGYKQALELSKKTSTPIFVYFQADWCRYCRKLEKELLYTHQGKQVLNKVIKVRVTPEKGENERKLFEQYGGRGYPSIFIIESFDASPKKYYFMEKGVNGWNTKPASYLKQVIESLL
ncbi:MAG: thioredoxin family protein [Neptuniibacter sp.]